MDEHISVLDKQLCLVINRHWVVIGCLSIKKAIVALAGGIGEQHPAMGMDIEMGTDENGESILINARPVSWEAWLELPIRDEDLYIQTNRMKVRAPTVIITGYAKVPTHRPRLSTGNIYDRDGGIDQYTGERISRHVASVDHVIPRSRGGTDVWHNLVTTHKRINAMKADKLPHEAGLKLIRQPKAPPSLPISATIKEARHQTWLPFLIR